MMLQNWTFCVSMLLLAASLSSSSLGEGAQELTVMTYNVLYGAGVNAQDEQIANKWSSGKYHGNRLEQIISVIKHVNPDILGVEEASHWDENDDASAKRVARKLGMNYFVGKSGYSRFHVALFSKLPILSAKNFPDQFTRAAIEAELKLPDGRVLHTFVAHFDLARSGEGQLREIRYLAAQMRPHAFDLGVMMGDANMWYKKGTATTDALLASGFLIAPSIVGIDQIWVSRPLADKTKAGPAIPPEVTDGVSDHQPSVVVISIPPLEKAHGDGCAIDL